MPSRILVAKELGEIFKVLAHPDRIRLIEELRAGEKDVNTLSERLELPSPRVSQHLSLLRLHRIVAERREAAITTTISCSPILLHGSSTGSITSRAV